jgi:hypothetical protein
MSFPIRTCAICGEEFELKPGKPGFANRCPACSEPDGLALRARVRRRLSKPPRSRRRTPPRHARHALPQRQLSIVEGHPEFALANEGSAFETPSPTKAFRSTTRSVTRSPGFSTFGSIPTAIEHPIMEALQQLSPASAMSEQPNPRRPARGTYRPRPETVALLRVSGNPINGLGETAPRRPSPFFWHPPDQHPWGDLQVVARTNSRKCPGSTEAFQAAYAHPELVPVAATRNTAPAAQLASDVAAFALAHEADAIGIAPMDPLYVFEGYTIGEPWVIVLALAHNYERLREVPSDETNGTGVCDVGDQYARGTRSSWIRAQGYNAQAFPGPSAGALALIPPAIASGLGELGKHGRSSAAISDRACASPASPPICPSSPPLPTASAQTNSVPPARSAPTPALPVPSVPKNKWSVGSSAGTSTSTNASPSLPRPPPAASASPNVPGRAPPSAPNSSPPWRSASRSSPISATPSPSS